MGCGKKTYFFVALYPGDWVLIILDKKEKKKSLKNFALKLFSANIYAKVSHISDDLEIMQESTDKKDREMRNQWLFMTSELMGSSVANDSFMAKVWARGERVSWNNGKPMTE